MIKKKQITALGLACLMSVLTLSPAQPALAAEAWEKSGGTYVGSDGTAIAGVVSRGIDVSHWKTYINWQQVAADDVHFVMLGTRYDNGEDPAFKTNAEGAAAAGLKVGAYLYSYATTTEMAVQEADFVLNLIKDYPISYPVVFDVESSAMSTLSPAQLADIINAFCKRIKDAGYYPMLYSNDYWLAEKIDMRKVKYDVWAARYDAQPAYRKAAMWQATNKGQINGISGDVDISFSFKNYDALIPDKIWRNIGGNWYYYSDYRMQKGWINDGNGWYYMEENGTQHKGWLNLDRKYYFLNESSGKMVTGWMQDAATSKWYFFGSDGAMRTGWIEENGSWYYLDPYGVMMTGWIHDDQDVYYYLKENGAMASGWTKLDGDWYYFNPSGSLVRGWSDIGGSRYLLGDDGKMASDWQKINDIWYFFGSDGAMRTGWQKLGGTWYYFNKDGQMLTGWQVIDGEYYYLHEGKMLTGQLTDSSGNLYYMDSSGKMARGWSDHDGSRFYYNQYGHLQKGWLNLSGKYYYLDPETGKMAANRSLVIDGISYTFDKNGVCQNETTNMSQIADSYFDPSVIPENSHLTGQNQTGGSSGKPAPAGSAGSGQTSVPGGGTAASMSGAAAPQTGSSQAPGSSFAPAGGSQAPGSSFAPAGGSQAPGSSFAPAGGQSSSGFDPATMPGGSFSDQNTIAPGLTTGPGQRR